MIRSGIFLIIIMLVLPGCFHPKQDKLKFVKMLVEYKENPADIDRQHPRFSWIIHSEGRKQKQSAYRILVAESKKLIDKNKTDFWDSGEVQSSETIQHELKINGLQPNKKYYWKVIVRDDKGRTLESSVAGFKTALFNESDWEAQWIGNCPGNQPLPENGFFKSPSEQYSLTDTVIHNGNSLLLRKEVKIDKEIESATAFVTGLGFYEFFINGQHIGDAVLAPAKTPYHKHILYDTYDVTDFLKKGNNAFGFHLGNGWYNPYKKWWAQYRMQWFGHKKATGQIHVRYIDGTFEIISTDKTWKCEDGPIVYNCIYDGEEYDARLEKESWSEAGFNDAGWKQVTVFEKPAARVEAHTMPAVKVIQTLKPLLLKSGKNFSVFDMGQNFTGWIRIKVKGENGETIKMRFAEDIYPDSTIDTRSNENAKATASYILKGEGVETYEPHFTYFGFKYVEISTDNSNLNLDDVEGYVVHTDNNKVGSFYCDNDLVNKIHRATVWSQKSNMLGYPMDCPQRDERLGWLGDAQVTAEEAMFNFDMAKFYENWFEGIKDNQNEKTGDLPIISPQPYIWDEGVEWSSTYFTMLWQYYLFYGDKNILAQHYTALKKYMQFLDSISVDFILSPGWIGDWGSMVKGWQEGQPESVPTAFYYFDATIMSKIANVLSNKSDYQNFKNQADSIRIAFNAKFFDRETGNYNDGSQMANAFPLFLGIVPEHEKERVLENLIEDIVVKNGTHLTTGVLGTKYLPEALVKFRRADVAWNLINQKTFPGWNIMMEKYTTMCEFWTLKQSKNHVMMGSIDAWFYKYIAGIQPVEFKPAFSEFIVKPYLPEGLTHAEAGIETIRGYISSKWKLESNKFTLEVEIPFNTSAIIHVPGNQSAKVFESGRNLEDAEGTEYLMYDDNAHQVRVFSGKYKFELEI